MCRFQLGVRRAPFQEFQAGGTQVGGAPGRQGGAAGVNQETHLLFLLDGTMTSRWALRPFPAVNQSQSNECRGRKSWRHAAVTRWKWCEMVRNCWKCFKYPRAAQAIAPRRCQLNYFPTNEDDWQYFQLHHGGRPNPSRQTFNQRILKIHFNLTVMGLVTTGRVAAVAMVTTQPFISRNPAPRA